MKLPIASLVAAITAAVVPAAAVQAEVKLPALLSEGCVLQQKAPVRIYGTAAPGEKVTVSLAGQTRSATTGPDGNWQTLLTPLSAGGPFTLTVKGTNTIVVKDVLVGEVWVCSGQSNMQFTLAEAYKAPADIAASNDPQLRMFTVADGIARNPQSEIRGWAWQKAAPETAGGFSAVGYYFARALRQSRKVPIGMIHTSWGGTRIEAWTRKDVLLAHGTPASEFVPANVDTPAFKAAMAVFQTRLAAWKAAGSPSGRFDDPGRAAAAQNWESADYDDSGWNKIPTPGVWENSGIEELAALDGAVWYRKVVDVPTSLAGRAATLSLGAIDDSDTTFVNGVKVGATGAEIPNSWQAPRRYPIPAGLLKPGKNVIAVRVWDNIGGGGMTGPDTEMSLEETFPPGVQTVKAAEKIALSGDGWHYKIENGRIGNPGNPPDINDPNSASGLYNAMLFPLTPYTIKGALWYQGESNAGNAVAYRTQMPAMIQNWRDDFGIKDFPFLIVQLAPFMAINGQPEDTGWAQLRESQQMATRALPNVGMAVITDVGDEGNIHPKKKQPVGERLALLARKIAYREKIVAEGPVYRALTIKNGQAVLTFDSAGSGLVARPTDTAGNPVPGGKLVGFSVAGSDGRFVWADAQITGKNTVMVSSPLVPEPKAVRFGWANYPVVNLWNAEGLPASPFRTDAPPVPSSQVAQGK